MLFSSLTFLYYFLPVTLLVYFVVPMRIKNGVLLAASLIFYAWGEPKYIVLMIISIIVGYIAGRWIEMLQGRTSSKYILAGTVLIHLGCFVYFKYANFILGNVNSILGSSFPMLKIAMPIGISFYTFQILSYELDVYRGKVKAQESLLTLATYISMFPQLIAGPIVRYSDIREQLEERKIYGDHLMNGIERLVIGLSKKVLIANALGELCEIFKASKDWSVLYVWLYAISFMLHIYYDFSGYSDMAIGLGRIFGFEFMENFNYPYISRSVTEFWRRWHMSLGQWFRDYVYIPLGGNQCKKSRWIWNILIVWFLTGLWHGAEWNFAAWGLYFAALLLIEKLWLAKKLEAYPMVGHVYTLVCVMIGFVLFNASNLTEALTYIGALFGIGMGQLVSAEFLYYVQSYGILLLIAMIGATPTVKKYADKMPMILELVLLVGGVLLVTASLVDGSFNPFLYFRF